MLSKATLQMLRQIAHGLCSQFGSNCEVVVHDLSLRQPDSSIVIIENGHVSSRKLGDGPSHIVLEALRADPATLEDKLSYLTRTHDGRILKSSTIYIRDEDGSVAAIFAINYDITAAAGGQGRCPWTLPPLKRWTKLSNALARGRFICARRMGSARYRPFPWSRADRSANRRRDWSSRSRCR